MTLGTPLQIPASPLDLGQAPSASCSVDLPPAGFPPAHAADFPSSLSSPPVHLPQLMLRVCFFRASVLEGAFPLTVPKVSLRFPSEPHLPPSLRRNRCFQNSSDSVLLNPAAGVPSADLTAHHGPLGSPSLETRSHLAFRRLAPSRAPALTSSLCWHFLSAQGRTAELPPLTSSLPSPAHGGCQHRSLTRDSQIQLSSGHGP